MHFNPGKVPSRVEMNPSLSLLVSTAVIILNYSCTQIFFS